MATKSAERLFTVQAEIDDTIRTMLRGTVCGRPITKDGRELMAAVLAGLEAERGILRAEVDRSARA